jgi:hypothetical protein
MNKRIVFNSSKTADAVKVGATGIIRPRVDVKFVTLATIDIDKFSRDLLIATIDGRVGILSTRLNGTGVVAHYFNPLGTMHDFILMYNSLTEDNTDANPRDGLITCKEIMFFKD